MTESQLAMLLLGGGAGGGLMTKILFDWFKGNRNGNGKLVCPYNGDHAKAQLNKMDDLIREQATTNVHLVALVKATSDHFRESREMTDKIVSNIWTAAGSRRSEP